MKKRLLSIFLIVCLCAALLPTFAAAEETVIELSQESFDKAGAATIPKKISDGLGPWWYALPTGNYRLTENISLTDKIIIEADNHVTLDLAGYTLSQTDVQAIVSDGTLTLNDSSSEQSGRIIGNNLIAVQNKPAGTFILNGGHLTETSDGEYACSVYNGGTLYLNGGSIDGKHGAINNSGTIRVDAGKEGTNVNGYVENAGTIEDGRFYGEVMNFYDGHSDGDHVNPQIKGGVFHGKVTNKGISTDSAGSGVLSCISEIFGGVFYGMVENHDWGHVNGGVFLGETSGFDLTNARSVTYDTGDGANTGKVMGNKLSRPEDPTREGDTFLGWYNGNTLWDFENDVVTGDITLTARWKSEQLELETGFAAILDDIPFVDVDFNDYFYDSVKWAYHFGVTGGTDAWHFSPDAGCTRAQAVTFLWRAAGSPTASYLGNFSDVDADAYYAPAVAWAVANGVTNGTSATTFSPEAPCSRGDIVTFLYRAFGGVSNGYHPFDDVPASAYYADAVAWAYEHGVTGGTSADKFSPADACSRAQIVTFLYRVLG